MGIFTERLRRVEVTLRHRIGVIPGRIDIRERPAVVEEKSRVGDWEVDTIIGAKHQGALVSVVDRASKFTFLEHVTGKTAGAVGAAIRRCLMPVLALVHTITADNGKEFAGHQLLAKTLSALFFFATPYHSWERGLNEHTNGLVRQYFPKSTDFKTLDPAAVKRVQELLNNRPRPQDTVFNFNLFFTKFPFLFCLLFFRGFHPQTPEVFMQKHATACAVFRVMLLDNIHLQRRLRSRWPSRVMGGVLYRLSLFSSSQQR